ncbi:MAG: hypothetical protein CME70_21405 [Halobacteriovorax sp.]|nr:hypothetical protein [Halobacteriovorax sp.]|tara:strand:- start:139664 stop:140836 length:1173 start_codon:yes stop_codon:yes gene_type:complete
MNNLTIFFNRYLKFIPIYIFSNYQKNPVRLYLLMPIFGLIYLFKKRDLPKIFVIYSLVGLIPFIFSASRLDFYGMKRAVLTGLLILFLGFLLEFFTKENLSKLAKGSFSLIWIFSIFEFLTGQYSHKEILSGISNYMYPHFQGITGYSNHSGVLAASLFSLFLADKSYRWALGTIPLVLVSASRAGFLVMLVALILYFIWNWKELYSIVVSRFIILCCLFSPLLAVGLEQVLSDDVKIKLSRLSHHRYAIQLTYVELAKDKPLGVGVDQSQTQFLNYKDKGSSIVENGKYEIKTGKNANTGAHNMFIKILCENGIIPYLIFMFFIFYIGKVGKTVYLIPFSATLTGYLTLNGLLEFPFYLIMAFMLKEVYEREEGLFKPFLSSLKVKERS